MLDERALGRQLIRGDAEALEERGIDPEPDDPHADEHEQAGGDQPEPTAYDLDEAGDRAEAGQDRQRAQDGQRSVDVGVGRSEDHAAGGVEQLEAFEPEADGGQRQEDGTE